MPKFTKRMPGLLTEKEKYTEKFFDPNPGNRKDKNERRRMAEEESLRDLQKEPEQLLADAHDESLDDTRCL